MRKIIFLGLACAAGCEPSPETVPLTDEQWEIIHRKVDDVERSEAMYAVLADAAGLSSSDLESAEEGRELLGGLEANGQFFGYHGNESSERFQYAFAYFHEDASGRKFIGINLDAELSLEYLGGHDLLHEAVHDQAGQNHSADVAGYVRSCAERGDSYMTDELAEAVLEHDDLPYLASLVGAVPDRLIYRAGKDLELVGSGYEPPIAKDQATWAAEMAEDVTDYFPYLDVFGLGTVELRRIFEADESIYPEAHEAWVTREREAREESVETRRMSRR